MLPYLERIASTLLLPNVLSASCDGDSTIVKKFFFICFRKGVLVNSNLLKHWMSVRAVPFLALRQESKRQMMENHALRRKALVEIQFHLQNLLCLGAQGGLGHLFLSRKGIINTYRVGVSNGITANRRFGKIFQKRPFSAGLWGSPPSNLIYNVFNPTKSTNCAIMNILLQDLLHLSHLR